MTGGAVHRRRSDPAAAAPRHSASRPRYLTDVDDVRIAQVPQRCDLRRRLRVLECLRVLFLDLLDRLVRREVVLARCQRVPARRPQPERLEERNGVGDRDGGHVQVPAAGRLLRRRRRDVVAAEADHLRAVDRAERVVGDAGTDRDVRNRNGRRGQQAAPPSASNPTRTVRPRSVIRENQAGLRIGWGAPARQRPAAAVRAAHDALPRVSQWSATPAALRAPRLVRTRLRRDVGLVLPLAAFDSAHRTLLRRIGGRTPGSVRRGHSWGQMPTTFTAGSIRWPTFASGDQVTFPSPTVGDLQYRGTYDESAVRLLPRR